MTVLVLGGALFAYHRWQKSKTNGNGLRLAVPNRRVNYESEMINFESSQANKFNNESLDLEFINPAYEENGKEINNFNFTDFTGSREIGIDIGTLEENSIKHTVIMKEISEKEDGLRNLRIILNECIKTETIDSKDDYKKSENENTNLYQPNKFENLKIENEEINFDYFDEYKNSQYDAGTLKNNSECEEKKSEIDEANDLDSFDEKTEDVANIFSKNIEKNLPELFGEYLEDELDIKKQKKEIQLDQESLESAAKDSLNISTDEKSEEEDFKPIHKNAFKNIRVEQNNKFVIDENKSSFKELIKKNNENLEKNQNCKIEFNQENHESKQRSNKADIFKILTGGIGNFQILKIIYFIFELYFF